MALPFDTPGRLERRIAQGMADQSSDSSLGALASLARRSGSHGTGTRGLGSGGRTGAYAFGDGGNSMSLSMSSSASWDESRQVASQDAQANDENKGASSTNSSRKISPLPRANVLGERSLNAASIDSTGPTLAKALARSHDVADAEEGNRASRHARIPSSQGPPSVSSATSSHASVSDVRVRSPPLTSTPHPSHINSQSSPVRSASSLSRSSNRMATASGLQQSYTDRPASAQESFSHTASGGFRSAVEESPLVRSRSSHEAESVGVDLDYQGAEMSTANGSTGQPSHREQMDGLSQTSVHPLPSPSLPKDVGLADTSSVKERFAESGVTNGDSHSPSYAQEESDLTMSPEQIRTISAEPSYVPNRSPQLTYSITTPRTSKIDQNYMRSYVLSAVKTANPLREAQLRHMTPRPNPLRRFENGRLPGSASRALATLPSRLRQEQNPVLSSETSTSYAESIHSDASSTRDLTVPAHLAGRGNSSLPDTGPDLNMAGPAARVDAARLQGYLHKINLQLEEENVALRDDQDELRRQFERALRDNEKLHKRLESMRPAEGPSRLLSPTSTAEAQVNNSPGEIAELRNRVDELNTLIADREAELGKLRRRDGKPDDSELYERIRELEDELEEERRTTQIERKRFDNIMLEAKKEADNALAASEERFSEERKSMYAEINELRASIEQPAEGSGDSTHSETARLRGTLHRTQAQLDDHNAQLDDALQQVEYLERQLAERYDLQREAENQTADCRLAISELETEVNEIKEQLEYHRSQAEEAADKAFDLNIAVEEKQSDIIRLEMLLRQAQNSPEATRLKEKVTLLETQLQVAKETSNISLHGVTNLGSTSQGATPMHRNIAALRKPVDTPRSPAELSSASWLHHDSTLGEKAVLRDIAALRGEVDAAHRATDDIIAQLSASQMAERIVQLQGQLDQMQVEAARQKELEERFRRRVERLKCGACKHRLSGIDLDTSMDATITVTAEGSTRAIDTQRFSSQKEQVLAEVAQQLSELKSSWAMDQARLAAERKSLAADREQFDSEKAHLKDENRRLKHEKRILDRRAHEQVKQTHEGTLQDLSRARRVIGEFEREFREDCDRYQQAIKSSNGVDQETARLEHDLELTRSDLARIEKELHEKISAFEKLEKELLETSQMDAQLPLHVKRLESEVRLFSSEVERLRSERNDILEQRQTLFLRRRKTQADHMSLSEELMSAREAIAIHQQQLDAQIATIEHLRGMLQQQSKALQDAQGDRDRLQEQRQAVLTDVASLEADLRRVRNESRRFGEDLAALRQVRNRADGTKGNQTGSRADDLDSLRKQHRTELAHMIEQQQVHDAALHTQYRAQCRGLLLQIRYEKAKFMRESDLRADLVHQKKYILGVLGGLEMTEEATVRFLADVSKSRARPALREKGQQAERCQDECFGHSKEGYPSDSSAARARFRAAGWAVLAICRARLMARNWQSTIEVKRALRQAHQQRQEK